MIILPYSKSIWDGNCWRLLTTQGGRRRRRCLLENRSVYFGYFLRLMRLALQAAEGGRLPWGRGQAGWPHFLSICPGDRSEVSAGSPAWSLPTPHTCRKLQKKPGRPHPGHRWPQGQGSGWPRWDHHRHWPPRLGQQGLGDASAGHIPSFPHRTLRTRAA